MQQLDRNAVDLTNCDREPIHLIGSIQPHGFVLAFTKDALMVKHCSANASKMLGIETDLLGCSIDEIFDIDLCEQIRQSVPSFDFAKISPLPLTILGRSEPFYQATFCQSGNLLLMECEAISKSVSSSTLNTDWQLASVCSALFAAKKVSDLLTRIAIEVRRITDFDRVLVYKFDQDWNGDVVAESRQEFMPSYLNHKFPATDIPSQARDLYTKNWIRLLVDVDATPVSMLCQDELEVAPPIDLSYAVLRSMSPIHIEYLKNMNVKASMSVSIVENGKLWGLIVCHHNSPKFVDVHIRSICQLFAQALSLLVAQMESHELVKYRLELKNTQDKLLRSFSTKTELVSGVRQSGTTILKVARASGFVLFFEGTVTCIGETPPNVILGDLRDWLNSTSEKVVCSSKLSTVYPEAQFFNDTMAGLLAVPICKESGDWLIWFRRELIEEVKWAGEPTKYEISDSDQGQLHPRKSFRLWKETVYGTSSRWISCEIDCALELRNNIVNFVLGEFVKRHRVEQELQKQREQFHVQRKELKDLSIRDALTGLFNRRYMEEYFGQELIRSKRKGCPLSIVMIDIDHFKRVNDTFGHEAGDAILRGLGDFLRMNLRGSDVTCRYGGEEFIVLLPEAPIEVAYARAEQLCLDVKSIKIAFDSKILPPISISIGVASFPNHGGTIEEIYREADVALYHAKESGRDRVCVAPPLCHSDG